MNIKDETEKYFRKIGLCRWMLKGNGILAYGDYMFNLGKKVKK